MNTTTNAKEHIPKVSIGMPIYNGEKLIRDVLDSLLGQTFAYFELIISDNASTDSTSEICNEYAKKDKRIRYIRQPSYWLFSQRKYWSCGHAILMLSRIHLC